LCQWHPCGVPHRAGREGGRVVRSGKQHARLETIYSTDPEVLGREGQFASDELHLALAEWRPRGDFAISLNVLVGAVGESGTDSFDLTLCNPGWLAEYVREHGLVDGRHFLIVHEYDYELVERYLRDRIEAIEGDSWPEIAMKIDEIAEWESKPYPD
jgi:hypothetical protein